MREFFESGNGIDIAIAVVALELLVLLALGKKRRPGLAPLDLIGQLAAGVFLLFAVRCAIRGADYRWTALMLTASFPAHVFDLVRRARGARASEPAKPSPAQRGP